MPGSGWIRRNERILTWALALTAVAAVGVAATIRYGPGHTRSSTRTPTTVALGESMSKTAETSGPAFPKSALHPGALDTRVTQANVRSTICRAGWVDKVRPSAGFLAGLERTQLADEAKPGTGADYDEDHLVPLELGGDPKDPKNLWPQPWENRGARLVPPGSGAESKDRVELKLHDEVCRGALTLRLAQQTIAANWQLAGTQL
jgi:hypothetical protein